MADRNGFSRSFSPVLNRREALLGAAGLAGAAAAWPGFVWAQAAPHSFKQGDFEVTVVSDGHLLFPAGAIAPTRRPMN